MNAREHLIALAKIIADEAERNSGFRRRLEEVFRPGQGKLPNLPAESLRDERLSTTDGSRKGGRRPPGILDPLALARQSEEVLRQDLSTLDIEQLKDVVAQYGMDPGKLVMKWKDTARIIDRIVELSLTRSTKGDAFRADKPTTESPRD